MEILVRVEKREVEFEEKKDLSGLTFFKTKGKAEYFYEPENPLMMQLALEKAYKMNLETRVLGSGTHVIISDEGIEGLLISTKKMRGITIKGNLITAYSGESLDGIINTAIEHNLIGLEELGGIPGTIAAALKVNASANGKSLSDYHYYSDFMTKEGKIHRRPDYFDLFGHQTSPIADDEIVLSVTLRLEPSKRSAEARIKKEKYVELMFIPPCRRCSGIIFRDPEGLSAADLIREAGFIRDRNLRELVHGMLRLLFSENHQGFVFDHRMEPGQFVIGGKQALVHGIEPQRRILYCVHGVALLPEHQIGSAEQEPAIPVIEQLKSHWVLCSDQSQNLRQIGIYYITLCSKHTAYIGFNSFLRWHFDIS